MFSKLFNKSYIPPHPQKSPKYPFPIKNKSYEDLFKDCSDFTTRKLNLGGKDNLKVNLYFIDGLVNGTVLNEDIILPLCSPRLFSATNYNECIEFILNGAVYCANMSLKTSSDDIVEALIKGFAVLIFEDIGGLAFEVRSIVQRGISEPKVEKALKGSKDAFVEPLRTNTTLLRRKIRTPDLKMLRQVVGRRSDTETVIIYIEGIANEKIVKELQKRLSKLDIDGLIESGYLEDFIVDTPTSPFPQIMHTERPDRLAMNLLDGRVALIVDEIPLAFMVPATLPEIMKVPEAKAEHFLLASFLRLIRYLGLILSLLFPAIYVALSMFHQEMIPLELLSSIIASKQQVPFGTALEIIGMLISFELLQEAGLRLPEPVGQTVGIIGGLIVGQSAVEAKIISPIAVIVVALSGIAGYTIPNQDLSSAIRLCRFLLVFFALLGGLMGIIFGLILIFYHLCSIESYGVSYMSPFCDEGFFGLLRGLLSFSLKKDKYRSPEMKTKDKRNQGEN